MTRSYTFALARRPDLALIVRIPEDEQEPSLLLLRRCKGGAHSTLCLARFETAGRAGAVAGFLLALTAAANTPAPQPMDPSSRSIYGGPRGHHCWN